MIKLKLSILFIFLFIASNNLLALTLNKMQVNSKQDEPLDAVIDVIYSKGDNASNLKPAIASKENYEANGLSRLSIHSDINIRLEDGASGAKIFLTSKEIVKDPFLDLLIQIDSEKGRVYKEYTVLLEPPAPKTSIKELIKDKNREEGVVEKKDEAIKVKNEPVKKAQQDVKNVKKLNKQKEDKFKILRSGKGKTLYQIARENKSSGVTTEQMVLAIYRSNPKAFSEENVNTLINNKKLRIPPVSYFENHSHLEARKILREQNTEWKKNIKKILKPKKIIKVSTQEDVKIKQLEKELREAKNKLESLLNISNTSKIEQKSSYLDEKKATDKILPKQEQAKDLVKEPTEQVGLKNKKEAFESESTSKEEVVDKEKIITQAESDEKNDDVFVSSISDIDQNKIDETEIVTPGPKGFETIHVLLLVLFFILLFGLFIVISRRKASERNQALRSFVDENESTSGAESSIDPLDLSSSKGVDLGNIEPISVPNKTEGYDKDATSQKIKKNNLPISDDD